MSELTRLHDEAVRLLTVYDEHKHSADEALRRKVHIDLDHFLMCHREVAAILFVEGLQREIDALKKKSEPKRPWYQKVIFKRFKKGGIINASNQNIQDKA